MSAEVVITFFDTLSIFKESVCEKLITGRKKKMINMLNNEQDLERALRFALGKLATDDGFCTGAGFIINYNNREDCFSALGGSQQKYVSFGF